MCVRTSNIVIDDVDRKVFNRVLSLRFIVLLLNFILIIVMSSLAQDKLKFKHLSINDGLSQNAVFAILQDSRGFMWFGTKDGLNRYDGYSFKVFYNNPFDSTSISANYITALFEDSRGRIWIGTIEGEINIYQYESGIFKHLDFKDFSETLTNSSISSIVEDTHSNIWIGTTGNGLFRINNPDDNLQSQTFTHFLNEADDDFGLSSNDITSMFIDSKGVLWIGTIDMLNMFDEVNKSFKRYKVLTKNINAPVDRLENGITSIYETKDHQLWLGTLSGLVLFERNSGEYKLFPHQYNVFRFGWGRVIGIIEDDSGNLWLTSPAGLMNFDPFRKSYEYYKNDPFDLNSLSFNMVSSIWRDRTGIFWFGTSGGGINIYDPKANRFSVLVRKKELQSRISAFSVRSILEDNSGNVWVSTDVLYKWNRNTGEIKSYEIHSDYLDVFGNTGAWSISQASSGKIWFATTQGLFSYDPITARSRLYKYNSSEKSGLPQKEVYTVLEDIENDIWIVTKNYLSKLINEEEGIFQNFIYVNNPSNSERVRPVLYEDSKHQLWLGTKDGLLQFDKRTEKFTAYRNNPSLPTSLNSNFIKSIFPDPFEPDNILWLGTEGGGLNRLNIETKTFTHFTKNDGLPNNVVYGILPDEMGNLWLSTNKGLSRFNIKTSTFRNFDISDGLQSNEFNTGAYFKSSSGEMFFGGIKGLNYFYPEEILDNQFIPNIVVTDIRLLNRSESSEQIEEFLKRQISELELIELSYDDNFIQFEFASLDYSASEKNQYAYKLENFNDDWVYSGTVRTATYTNLSPGEYTFRVKGSNNDGVWNEKGASIYLIIYPPWWSTWWAYSLYGILVLTGLYQIRRYELNRLKLKNQLKLEKVQSNTLRQVDRMKSRFFTNISHEFRTPLTLILGQIDSLQSTITDNKNRGKLQVAYRNAQRVLRLINQLLDLSKLEAGSMKLKTQRQNLISFIKSLFYSFESLAEKKNITLNLKTETGRLLVDIDPEKMEKVFYNLLSNAFKFTPEGGKISLVISKTENELAEIRIKDTGAGISKERLPHIFNRFYQADDIYIREQEGSGIGLALAKELTELHNGRIKIESKIGEGTEFIISIPLSNSQSSESEIVKLSDRILAENKSIEMDALIESDNPKTNPKTKLAVSGLKKNNKQIVLVVEDNFDVRSYICEQLEEKYSIAQATNGLEGMSQAENFIPDLIITDVIMPKMDGYEFCKEIRMNEKTSHIPIIMLTAKAALDDKIEGLETGIDAYLTKPFSAKELVVRVSNLIHQREQLRKRFRGKTVIKPSDVTAASIDQTFLEKVLKTVDVHIQDESFGVENLAEEVFMSVSQLNRKLHALIDQPAGQLIRSMRLNRAAGLLKQNAGSVAEICYMVGFNDQSYFTRSFKKQFGSTPSEFKKQGN